MMLFFDFDGTIVDLWPRYHAVFRDLCGLDGLGLAEYRRAKQRYGKDADVAAHFKRELPEGYPEKKKGLLEERRYLEMDRLLFPADRLNPFLRKGMILTKRRDAPAFGWELARLGIRCDHCAIDALTKKEWIEKNHPGAPGIMIGDAASDLEASGLPYIRAWMVGYGLGTREQFDGTGYGYRYAGSPRDLLRLLEKEEGG